MRKKKKLRTEAKPIPRDTPGRHRPSVNRTRAATHNATASRGGARGPRGAFVTTLRGYKPGARALQKRRRGYPHSAGGSSGALNRQPRRCCTPLYALYPARSAAGRGGPQVKKGGIWAGGRWCPAAREIFCAAASSASSAWTSSRGSGSKAA